MGQNIAKLNDFSLSRFQFLMFGMKKKKMKFLTVPKITETLLTDNHMIVFGWARFYPPLYLMNFKENVQIATKTSHQLLEVIASDSILLSSLHIFQEIL